MAQICPTCGQPIPEGPAGQTPPADAGTPKTPAAGVRPPRRFPAVKVAVSAVALVILGGGYLIFGGRKPLAERLYSERQDVRDAALAELANMESADRAPVIETLAANLGGPDPRKMNCALDVLLRLKLPAEDARPVLPALQTLMRGPDFPAAMQALAAARYVAPRPPDVQSACLEVIRSQAVRLSSTGFLAVLTNVSQSLSPTGEAILGLPAALGSLAVGTADPVVRTSALGVVAQMSSTAQAEAGTVVALGAFSATSILQGLQDPNPANRSALLGSIMKVIPHPADVVPQLVLLARNPAPVLRITAAEVLMSITPTSTSSWVAVTGLLKDADVEVRRATVAALKPRAKDLPKMAVTALIALLKDKDEGVREDAAAALAPLPSARVKQALAAYAKAKASAEAAAAEPAAAGAPGTEPAPGEPAAATAAPGEPAATTAAPGEPASPATASTEAAAGGSASPCPMTPAQATDVAKGHLPRSLQGACKADLEFSASRSEADPCVFQVTASCQGEALRTCEVNGASGEYTWSQ